MIVGYARTSTLEQVAGFEAQKRDLEAAGCQECYEEQVSSVAERTELEAALKYVRKGDTFVVTKLDRLARSVRDLCRIVDMLDKKAVALRILNLGFDTGTATGKLVVQILGAIADDAECTVMRSDAVEIHEPRGFQRCGAPHNSGPLTGPFARTPLP